MKYVGIDWGSEIHLVALLDEDGTCLDQWEVEHSRRGVESLLERLARHGEPGQLQITIEAGAPLLVDQLIEAGYPRIFEVNPKQADRFRDRHSPAGCKDDQRDAWCCAAAGRTDSASLTRVVPDGPLTMELKRRVRARIRLVNHRVRATLRLRDTLARFFPAVLELKRDMHNRFLLSLLEAYPTPSRARRATKPRLERLLRENRIRALDATRVQAVLKAAAFSVPEPIEVACADETQDLVAQIRLLNTQIQTANRRIAAVFARHPDRELVLAMPGMGEVLAPGVLAELGDDPRRRTQHEALTVYSGSAPVTKATGTRKKRRKNGQRASVHVHMRYGCNRRLQTLLWCVARASVARSRWARAYVTYRRERGHAFDATIRALSLKWGKILAHILLTRKPYDEDLHVDHLTRNNVPWAGELKEKAA